MVRLHEGEKGTAAITMKKLDRAHWFKIALLAVYVLVLGSIYAGLQYAHIPFHTVPNVLRLQILRAGIFGPAVLVVMYVVATIIPFPTAAIAVLGGVLYGSWLGSLTVILGVNAAATVSFWLARYLGRHFISEHEQAWVKKYDDLLSSQGMFAVMAMRLLFFPFDVVGIGAGLTRMSFRQYIIGSFLGTLPHVVSLVVLGHSFESPRTWGLFAGMMLVSIVAAIALHRSEWAKKYLLKQPKEPV
jgi:uncharacterized membrane protein YdjX (TVP38/TMEM64 family)